MTFNIFNIAILSLSWLNITFATPTPPPIVGITSSEFVTSSHSRISKRAIGGLEICTEKDFKGQCNYMVIPTMYECWNLYPEWQNQISSFRPDKTDVTADAFDCVLFSEMDCAGEKVWNPYPGLSDLAPSNMDNMTKSFLCRYM